MSIELNRATDVDRLLSPESKARGLTAARLLFALSNLLCDDPEGFGLDQAAGTDLEEYLDTAWAMLAHLSGGLLTVAPTEEVSRALDSLLPGLR